MLLFRSCLTVAPLVGAWIEMLKKLGKKYLKKSLPLWERGLKYLLSQSSACAVLVAPLVGAWIEISNSAGRLSAALSLPLWERGLKFSRPTCVALKFTVAPLVGAWIEMVADAALSMRHSGRSPCGSVD